MRVSSSGLRAANRPTRVRLNQRGDPPRRDGRHWAKVYRLRARYTTACVETRCAAYQIRLVSRRVAVVVGCPIRELRQRTGLSRKGSLNMPDSTAIQSATLSAASETFTSACLPRSSSGLGVTLALVPRAIESALFVADGANVNLTDSYIGIEHRSRRDRRLEPAAGSGCTWSLSAFDCILCQFGIWAALMAGGPLYREGDARLDDRV